MELLLTVEQAAQRLQLAPFTVREQLKRGQLRGLKRGRVWRIPESALTESSPPAQAPGGRGGRSRAVVEFAVRQSDSQRGCHRNRARAARRARRHQRSKRPGGARLLCDTDGPRGTGRLARSRWRAFRVGSARVSRRDTHNPQRGEVWNALLDPVEGSEMGGHNPGETRPVIVISATDKGRSTMRVCVPLTSFQDEHALLSWCILIAPEKENGLSQLSTAETSQIRALSTSRLQTRRGHINDAELYAIGVALNDALGFDFAEN